MKREQYLKVIDEVISDMISVADEVLDELKYQFEEIKNPEKLLGRPYETWTRQDLMMLSQVYGTEEPNPLSELIFRKKWEQVKALEAEELR